MHIVKLQLFSVLLVLLAACAPTVEVTPLGALPTTRSSDATAQVFTNSDAITRPYREVALITVGDDGWGYSEGELLTLLLERANEIGAEGVIVLGQETRSTGGAFIPTGNTLTYYEGNERIVRGSAFVYTD
jgi:hypothetical protein